MPALFRPMNGASRRLYLNHSAILGSLVIFTALSCDLNNPLGQDAGTSKDAGAGQDTGHTCPPLGGACQTCPNGYLADASGCATCQCKPPTTCGPVCDIFCAYGNVLDAQGCATCSCNPPPSDSCTVAACGPVPPIAPQICPDGKTVAGVTCLRDQTGVCRWSGLTCPPPTPCPCAVGQLCVTQIGGPAIPSQPLGQCEAPDQACLERVDTTNPCACLAAGDGKCTPSSAGNCTCDDGIR